MSLNEIRSNYVKNLEAIYSHQEARNLFNLVVREILGYTAVDTHRYHSKDIAPESEKKILEILNRLCNSEPLQYIFGYTWFYDIRLITDSRALIPRPETEYLVHLVIQELKNKKSLKILDVCTGGGCIAIAIKKFLNECDVHAIDFSPKALELAKENSLLNNLEINFINDNFLKRSQNYPLYNCIISNPPYVREMEKGLMHQNVLDFEPHLALFVEDKNPLKFYKTLAEFGQSNLLTPGFIWCEINEALGSETAALFERLGYMEVEIRKDLNNKDRFLKAKWIGQ